MDDKEKWEPCECPAASDESLPKNMYLAAKYGDLKKIAQFIRSGNDINAADDDGCTLLSSACVGGQVAVVRFLQKYKNLHRNLTDWSGDTPLMHAVRLGHAEVVKELLTKVHVCRLNIDTRNLYKDTALSIATAGDHAEIVKLVQERKLPALPCAGDLGLELPTGNMTAAKVVFECDVCLEEYNTAERRPRSLPCGHSLCTFCLTELVPTGRLVCPICRKVHSVPSKSAASIPINYAIDSILQQQ